GFPDHLHGNGIIMPDDDAVREIALAGLERRDVTDHLLSIFTQLPRDRLVVNNLPTGETDRVREGALKGSPGGREPRNQVNFSWNEDRLTTLRSHHRSHLIVLPAGPVSLGEGTMRAGPCSGRRRCTNSRRVGFEGRPSLLDLSISDA